MIRIFQNIFLNVGAEISLDQAASHHLINVLRVKLNDFLIIFNGSGGEFSAKIIAITKKIVQVKIGEFISREAESPLNICLIQGISRGEKMDFTLQKSVELGVKKIIPVFTERCNVKLDFSRLEKKWQHWQNIIISACEQSGRNFVPVLEKPKKLFICLNELELFENKFILVPTATAYLKKQKIASNANIALLIGSEGGLTETEIHFAETINFQPIALGPRILRTETAALVAIAALQTLAGDL